MEKRKLKQIIENLGGVDDVSAAINCGRSAVYTAISREHLPLSWHLRISILANEKNIKIPLSAFDNPKASAPQPIKEPAE